jgi:hypothetical protein
MRGAEEQTLRPTVNRSDPRRRVSRDVFLLLEPAGLSRIVASLGRRNRRAAFRVRNGTLLKSARDSLQATSGVHRAARDRDVLPGLSRQMARYWKRRGVAPGRVDARDGSYRAVVEKAGFRDSRSARPGPASMSCIYSLHFKRRRAVEAAKRRPQVGAFSEKGYIRPFTRLAPFPHAG